MNSRINTAEALRKLKGQIAIKLKTVGEFGVMISNVLVPVDTGRLKGSINYKVNRNEMTVRIGTNVEYAPYIEFGTGEFAESGQGRKGGWYFTTPEGKTFFTYGNKPQPFLRPLVTSYKDEIFYLMNK